MIWTAGHAAESYIARAHDFAAIYPHIKREDFTLKLQWIVALHKAHKDEKCNQSSN